MSIFFKAKGYRRVHYNKPKDKVEIESYQRRFFQNLVIEELKK